MREFCEARDRPGIPDFRFHDLRHTFTTALQGLGEMGCIAVLWSDVVWDCQDLFLENRDYPGDINLATTDHHSRVNRLAKAMSPFLTPDVQ